MINKMSNNSSNIDIIQRGEMHNEYLLKYL